MAATSTHRKRELFERIVRLRRAFREVPANRDIAAVRAALERDFGDTASVRLSAGLLGVSHTALNRWIAAGDVATVLTREGRAEVPLPVLLDLHDAVELTRRREPGRRHVLEPIMREGRRRAAALDVAELVPAEPALDGHRRAERRALAYHRALARHLDDAAVAQARHRLWRWREEGHLDPRHADRWEAILSRPAQDVARRIGEDTVEGRELRQTSPLAGMLSEPERRRILERVR